MSDKNTTQISNNLKKIISIPIKWFKISSKKIKHSPINNIKTTKPKETVTIITPSNPIKHHKLANKINKIINSILFPNKFEANLTKLIPETLQKFGKYIEKSIDLQV